MDSGCDTFDKDFVPRDVLDLPLAEDITDGTGEDEQETESFGETKSVGKAVLPVPVAEALDPT